MRSLAGLRDSLDRKARERLAPELENEIFPTASTQPAEANRRTSVTSLIPIPTSHAWSTKLGSSYDSKTLDAS
jgi:hypothetical protein